MAVFNHPQRFLYLPLPRRINHNIDHRTHSFYTPDHDESIIWLVPSPTEASRSVEGANCHLRKRTCRHSRRVGRNTSRYHRPRENRTGWRSHHEPGGPGAYCRRPKSALGCLSKVQRNGAPSRLGAEKDDQPHSPRPACRRPKSALGEVPEDHARMIPLLARSRSVLDCRRGPFQHRGQSGRGLPQSKTLAGRSQASSLAKRLGLR